MVKMTLPSPQLEGPWLKEDTQSRGAARLREPRKARAAAWLLCSVASATSPRLYLVQRSGWAT